MRRKVNLPLLRMSSVLCVLLMDASHSCRFMRMRLFDLPGDWWLRPAGTCKVLTPRRWACGLKPLMLALSQTVLVSMRDAQTLFT